MCGPDLGRHEHLVTANVRRVDALADIALVLIDLCGVDVAIAEPDRLLDDACTNAATQFPCPEANGRDAGAVCFHELHHLLL